MLDKLYVERAGGQWQAWTYCECTRVYCIKSYSYGDIERYAKKHHFRLIHVETNPD